LLQIAAHKDSVDSVLAESCITLSLLLRDDLASNLVKDILLFNM
jgi:hypothetical protein